MNDKLVQALRRKTGVEPEEMSDAVLLDAFKGSFAMSAAEMSVAADELVAALAAAHPRLVRQFRELFRRA